MESSVKISKRAEMPFFGGVIITVVTGSLLWSSLFYGISLFF